MEHLQEAIPLARGACVPYKLQGPRSFLGAAPFCSPSLPGRAAWPRSPVVSLCSPCCYTRSPCPPLGFQPRPPAVRSCASARALSELSSPDRMLHDGRACTHGRTCICASRTHTTPSPTHQSLNSDGSDDGELLRLRSAAIRQCTRRWRSVFVLARRAAAAAAAPMHLPGCAACALHLRGTRPPVLANPHRSPPRPGDSRAHTPVPTPCAAAGVEREGLRPHPGGVAAKHDGCLGQPAAECSTHYMPRASTPYTC